MARWATGAKWAEGPAPDDQRDMPLVLSLSEGLGRRRRNACILNAMIWLKRLNQVQNMNSFLLAKREEASSTGRLQPVLPQTKTCWGVHAAAWHRCDALKNASELNHFVCRCICHGYFAGAPELN